MEWTNPPVFPEFYWLYMKFEMAATILSSWGRLSQFTENGSVKDGGGGGNEFLRKLNGFPTLKLPYQLGETSS